MIMCVSDKTGEPSCPLRDNEASTEEQTHAKDQDHSERRCSRTGVLITATAAESLSSDMSAKRISESRSRRSQRLEDHDIAPEDFSVRFADLTIRDYPIILGDNPGGISGPPLSIAWKHTGEITIDLDEYESGRPRRRDHVEMAIPESERLGLLKRVGYSKTEIVEGTRPVNIIRSQRARSREALALQPVSELMEKISRKAKNAVTLGAKKRSERKFLRRCSASEVKLDGESYDDLSRKTSADFSENSELEA